MWNIQLEDLRIGSIIVWGKWPSVFDYGDYMIVAVNGADFSGVKITNEILELFSKSKECTRTSFKCTYLGELGLFSVDIHNEDGVFSATKICQYVHELQNFYHGVTGYDLEYDRDKMKEFLTGL